MTPESKVARQWLRAVCVLMSCLTLLVLWRLLVVLGLPPGWQLLLLCVVALWPMLQYVSAVVNNECLTYLFSATLCLAIVSRLRDGGCTLAQALWLGALVGLGLWVKQTTLFAAPLAFYAVMATGGRERRWQRALLFALAAAVVGCGWPLHNLQTAGEPFPNYVRPDDQDNFPLLLLAQPEQIVIGLTLLWETMVLPDWSSQYALLPKVVPVGIALLASAVLAAAWVTRRRQPRPLPQLCNLAVAALALLLLGVLQAALLDDWRAFVGGRYLLNGVPWALVLAGCAARRLRLHWALWLAPAALLALDLYWWTEVRWYYAALPSG